MLPSETALYATISTAVAAAAPPGWTQLRIRADLGDADGETVYDAIGEDGASQWFEPDTATQYTVYRAFQQLRRLAADTGRPEWCAAAFTLQPDGTYTVELQHPGPA